MHSEWFPLNYPDKFYDTILTKKNVIPIGCFIKLIVPTEEGGEQEQEVILGSIISRVKEQKQDITEIHEHYLRESQKQTMFQYLVSFISCKSMFQKQEILDIQGCYIMTLGVIDEVRKIGLGTMLLQQTYTKVAQSYPECEIIYLHVVDYNKSAINFYTSKNNFKVMKREIDHYVIFDEEYDALLLYTVIDRHDVLMPKSIAEF